MYWYFTINATSTFTKRKHLLWLFVFKIKALKLFKAVQSNEVIMGPRSSSMSVSSSSSSSTSPPSTSTKCACMCRWGLDSFGTSSVRNWWDWLGDYVNWWPKRLLFIDTFSSFWLLHAWLLLKQFLEGRLGRINLFNHTEVGTRFSCQGGIHGNVQQKSLPPLSGPLNVPFDHYLWKETKFH